MKIVEQTESVLQLQVNCYLVYSSTTFPSYNVCLNNSNYEVFVKTGPNRIFISPSCRMHLKDHVLISDFSLQLNSTIKHCKWDLDEIAFSPQEPSVSSRWLEVLGSKNVGRSTLNSIWQDIAIKQWLSSWKYIFSMLGVLVLVILAVAIVYVIMT